VKLFPRQQVSVPLLRAPTLVLHDLDAAMDRTAFHHLFRDRLVGDASEDRITIRRARPCWRNDFAPRFVGRVNSNRRAIEGEFRPSVYARGFVLVWVAMLVLLFLPIGLVQLAAGGWTRENVTNLAAIVGMLLFGGWLLPRLGWRMGRSDIAKIEAAIRRAADQSGA